MSKHNKYIINCSENAFDRSTQENRISGTPVVLDSKTAQAVNDAETLDRYDDFADLRINKKLYGRQGNSKYGIPQIREIHGNNEVILPHQERAAYDFLHELRGFGLLADVVGSGKTFEAGVVLSELAARGKLKSLLLVVPEQVYSNWKRVLEQFFGMGEGALLDIDDSPYFDEYDVVVHGKIELRRPKRPVIVKTEDFVRWTESAISNLLFDVVVVDEAHHLCLEDGENATALKFLAILMQNKKLVNSTYCLLLSATPHSGNLDKMFRLWYFIRCKGGYPNDFDEKEDKDRTEDYVTEKAYYHNVICRGAHTVSEYIAVSKKLSIDLRYPKEFNNYINATGRADHYGNYTEWEKQKVREEFLHAEGNEEICTTVLGDVARDYHNGVMRSIMIRQPNNLSKKRYVNNVFFCPVTSKIPDKVKFDNAMLNPYDPESDNGVTTSNGNYSLTEYLENIGQNNIYKRTEIWISNVLGSKVFEDKAVFEKEASQEFYWQQLQDCPGDITNTEFRFLNGYTKAKAQTTVFDAKIEELKKILDAFYDERVIIFFDYDQTKAKNEYEWDKVYKALEGTKHKKRLCLGRADNIKSSEKFFKETSDAVFIIGDPAYTEGSNYQESRVIVNFSVTPDPLAMDQRIGRIFRLGQKRDVEIYSFAAMNELEGYALAYFNRIGLLSSNSGDATIIAGSNNERMVAVKCPACTRMLLYPSDEYATRKLNNNLFCKETPRCTQDDARGSVMEEMNIYEFKCDKCGENLTRTEGEGYRCFAITSGTRGRIQNDAESGSRSYGCSKLCAIRHCAKIKSFKVRCALLDLPESEDIASASLVCAKCPNYKNKLCHRECTAIVDNIEACRSCDHATCNPRPHTLNFDDKWVAKCPKPGCQGHLRPIVAHTFDAYIRSSFTFNDGGRSFCRNLMQEANHVADIKAVLGRDEVVKSDR